MVKKKLRERLKIEGGVLMIIYSFPQGMCVLEIGEE